MFCSGGLLMLSLDGEVVWRERIVMRKMSSLELSGFSLFCCVGCLLSNILYIIYYIRIN